MNLKSAIINNAVIYNQQGSYLFNLRQLLLNGDFLYEISGKLWNKIKTFNPDILIGYGYGGALLLQPIRLFDYIPVLIAREERRQANTKVLVEGFPPNNKTYKAVFVDDNINTGSTLNKCLESLKNEGYNIELVGIVTITDFKKNRPNAECLFTRHELGLSRERFDAVEFQGKLKWHLYGHNKNSEFICSPPIIHNDVIYVGTNKNQFRAVDLETGDILWESTGRPCIKGIASKAVVANDLIISSSYDGYLTAFSSLGEVRWSTLVDKYLHSTPVYSKINNDLYLGTENKNRGDIVAVDIESGRVRWRVATNDYVPCSPAYNDKLDLLVCGSNDYHLYWIEGKTGKLLDRTESGAEIKGFVKMVGDYVITANNKGFLQKWLEGKLLNERNLGFSLHHSDPIIYQDLIIVGNTTGLVFGIDFSTFEIKWIAHTHGGVSYGLTLLDRRILVTSQGRVWSVIDALSGTKLELEHKMPKCSQPAAYANGVLVVATDYEGLLCVKI